ncbi:hypothetical protein [Rhodoferax sp. BLA1]|uniref:hypothetical protein n=1 Tax=Rhodoferax sp. BLA1 TaxID=2576062 RepID=UPI0015D38BC5|nr:hypothetical protein [Rhodoferax sp. BLA1]
MNKQVDPDVVGEQGDLRSTPIDNAYFEKPTAKTTLKPEQVQTIRSLAEDIVRQLCERHNSPKK